MHVGLVLSRIRTLRLASAPLINKSTGNELFWGDKGRPILTALVAVSQASFRFQHKILIFMQPSSHATVRPVALGLASK